MLEKLFQSAIAFRMRFSLPNDVDSSARKVFEEMAELNEAIIQYQYYQRNGFFRDSTERYQYSQQVVLEFIDVIYAGVNLCIALGFSLPLVSGYVQSIITKNDEKNLSNCTVVDGMVVRNEKLGKVKTDE